MTSRDDSGWLGPHRIHGLVDRCCAAHDGQSEAAIANPNIRDRVHIEGHDEVFFVVYVDVRRRLVDLVCGQRVGFLSDIPFSAVRPAPERERARWDFTQVNVQEEPPRAG
jgi:hypothetical protein